MKPEAASDVRSMIYDLLYSLGITANYHGFFFTSDAIQLALQQPERLLLISKLIYPDIAKHYCTTWNNVERCIRKTTDVAWKLRPERINAIAMRNLECRPTNAQFISMLSNYLQFHAVEGNEIAHT